MRAVGSLPWLFDSVNIYFNGLPHRLLDEFGSLKAVISLFIF